MKQAFQTDYDVSRETLERLDLYVALLLKWTAKINLISRTSAAHVWTRHIADSAQLWSLAPPSPKIWTDLGSGGGLPGLVVAILAREVSPRTEFHLVESDARKCAFLQTVVRDCDINARVHLARIEHAGLPPADVLSARALAPLSRLLEFSEKLRRPEGICLFPKGETVHKEIADASRLWRLECRIHPSRTESRAAIVEIGAFARV